MPFIGKNPKAVELSNFTTRVKDDFTPDGSTTTFTLGKAVGHVNDIEVFVGNVRQEPTDAYSVNGTTLTMTAAPASGLNFYVVHQAGTLESSVVPADNTISTAKIQNNAITGAKLDTTVDYYRAGTSEFMIGSDNGGTAQLTFYEANTSTKEGFLKYDGLNNKVVLGTSGASDAMEIERDTGYITKPNQPMCFVTRISEQGSITDDSNNGDVLVLNTEIFNVGNHYNDTNGRWTAPVAGKYEFSWSYATKATVPSVYRTFLWKNGSKLSYTQLRNDSNGNSSAYVWASRTAILDLAANDYVILQGSIDGSANTWYSDNELRTSLTVRLIG